jgi:hypothetical protein
MTDTCATALFVDDKFCVLIFLCGLIEILIASFVLTSHLRIGVIKSSLYKVNGF